jgi:hypothetical protein
MHDYIIAALAIVTGICLTAVIIAVAEYKSLKKTFNGK